MADVWMKVTGDKAVERTLANVEHRVARKAIKKGVGKGLLVMKREIKSRAKSLGDDGMGLGSLIAKNTVLSKPSKWKPNQFNRGIKQKFHPAFRYITKGSPMLGVKAGFKYWLPHAIEFGHALPGRGRSTGVKSPPKDIQPAPFIRKAFASKWKETVRIFEQVVQQEVNRA